MTAQRKTSLQRVKDGLGKLARAKLRHSLLTTLPDKLLGGTLKSRHLAREIHLRELELKVAGWPRAFNGLRIAHVSDLHVGDLLPVSRAIEVARVVARERVDLLACTGDMVDLHVHGNEPLGPALEAFAAVRARYGHWLVLGNHDHLEDAQEVRRLARQSGFTVLDGHGRSLAQDGENGSSGDHLRIGGIDWAGTVRRNSTAVDTLCAAHGVPHLLLAHNPKAFRRAAAIGVPLVLSGHTHGGQFALKRPSGPRRAQGVRLLRGHYVDGPSHLHITTGVGSWFPLRLNCPAEVVMITVSCHPD